jgi:hypothetical protein
MAFSDVHKAGAHPFAPSSSALGKTRDIHELRHGHGLDAGHHFAVIELRISPSVLALPRPHREACRRRLLLFLGGRFRRPRRVFRRCTHHGQRGLAGGIRYICIPSCFQ